MAVGAALFLTALATARAKPLAAEVIAMPLPWAAKARTTAAEADPTLTMMQMPKAEAEAREARQASRRLCPGSKAAALPAAWARVRLSAELVGGRVRLHPMEAAATHLDLVQAAALARCSSPGPGTAAAVAPVESLRPNPTEAAAARIDPDQAAALAPSSFAQVDQEAAAARADPEEAAARVDQCQALAEPAAAEPPAAERLPARQRQPQVEPLAPRSERRLR